MTKRPTSRLRAAPFFVMRVPLLSFEELRRWSEGAVRDGEGVAEGECAPPGSFEGERDRLRHGLLSLVERPYVREAIFLASPGFESLIEGWVADPLIEGHERIEQTLCKYFARMASRPTPFGLFATISTGKTASETDLRVPPAAEITRRSRLDLGFLDQLVEAMVRDRRWRGAVPLRANPTIYRSGDSIRYVEAPFDDQGKRRHHLVALRRSRALDGALEAAGVGAGREEIERSVEQTGAETGAAARFVDQLIDAQALVPAVGAAITGPDPMNQIAEIPSSAEVRAELAAPLQQAGEALREVDEAGGFVSPHRYREIAKTLDALPRRPSVSRLFQVDAARPRSGSTVGQEVVEEVMRGVELLEGFTPERGESDLTRFRYAFEERYGQRSVPLLEVLDSESGIGYPATRQATGGRSPLVQGLDLGRSLAERQPWGARERLLLRRMTLAASEGKTELLLRNEDLASLKEKRVEPFSNRRGVMAAMVRVAAPSSEELERGNFRVYLSGIDAPGGARLLARFGALDPGLGSELADLVEREERLEPGAVVAEIVHVPEGRAGNVLQREQLRRFEIPILGLSGAPCERQIALSDLWLSSEGDRLVLHSRRLGRRVIPRQTTAYDPSLDGVVVNRFLCALAVQEDVDGNRWDWGPLGSAPFLPRVRSGRTILSLATWNIESSTLASLRQLRGADRLRAVRRWREEQVRPIPRWIALPDGDEHLALDLDNPLFIDAFLRVATKLDTVTLVELFPSPGELVALGPEGRFVSELVLPLELAPEPGSGPAPRSEAEAAGTQAATRVQRRFPPGSDWLFVKLYCGPVTADQLLREVMGSFVREVMEDDKVRSWHFLRYGDPDWHLRLRFLGDPAVLRNEVLPGLNRIVAERLKDGRVWKLQADTYEREIERYGGPEAIEIAEEMFRFDSEFALWVMEHLEPGARGEEERWKLALCGVDRLLADFGMDLVAKQALIRTLKVGLGEEFGVGRKLRRELADRYRRYAEELLALLGTEIDPRNPLRPGLEALAVRSHGLASGVARFRDLSAARRLSLGLPELASSFIHLHVNRMLRSVPRATELVIYDFLEQAYRSKAALARRL